MAKFNTKQQKISQRECIEQGLDGQTLAELIELFTSLWEKHGDDNVLTIDIDGGYDQYDPTSVIFWVHSTHLETAEELEARHQQWKVTQKIQRDHYRKNRKLRDEKDKQEYVRLKEKFETEEPPRERYATDRRV